MPLTENPWSSLKVVELDISSDLCAPQQFPWKIDHASHGNSSMPSPDLEAFSDRDPYTLQTGHHPSALVQYTPNMHESHLIGYLHH